MALSNKVEPIITKYLFSKAVRNNVPLSGTFELSPCCNMDCKMCYVRKTKAEVNRSGGEICAEQWIELGRQCRDRGTLYILLTGGEPFLYKDFKKVYVALHNMGMQVSINTNATMISDEDVEWLKEYGPEKINVTIYGASNETYERLCGNKKGFDQMIGAVKKLKAAGLRVKFNCSLTPYNCEDIEEIFRIANGLEIYLQVSYYMFPPVRKENMPFGYGDRFSAEEAAKYGIKISVLRYGWEDFKKRRQVYLNNRDSGIYLADEQDTEECGKCPEEPLGCRAGRASFWVNWHGIMTPCGMMNGPEAYPFKDGFYAAWQQTVENTKRLHMPAKCSDCKHKKDCQVCGAMVYCETGNFDDKPKYICRVTEHIDSYMKMDTEELQERINNNENK